mmetsp:Transcript_5196/g.12506  ORF Transcript_5196/g.12506 Transcript_5196/m.12506 type:complete len:131 (+) Transcript_5196:459-851(+)
MRCLGIEPDTPTLVMTTSVGGRGCMATFLEGGCAVAGSLQPKVNRCLDAFAERRHPPSACCTPRPYRDIGLSPLPSADLPRRSAEPPGEDAYGEEAVRDSKLLGCGELPPWRTSPPGLAVADTGNRGALA